MRGSLNCSSAFSYSASFSSPVSSFHPWRVRRPQTSSSVASPVWTFVLRLLMSLVLNVGEREGAAAGERRGVEGDGFRGEGGVGEVFGIRVMEEGEYGARGVWWSAVCGVSGRWVGGVVGWVTREY